VAVIGWVAITSQATATERTAIGQYVQMTPARLCFVVGLVAASSTLVLSSPSAAASATVTIDQSVAQVDPTSNSSILFDVVFSEAVIGFVTGDVTLGGTAGATTATVTGGPTNYTVTVTGMTTTGTVIASIAAGRATDAASNPNFASTSTDNTVQWNAPLVSSTTSSTTSTTTSTSTTTLPATTSTAAPGGTTSSVLGAPTAPVPEIPRTGDDAASWLGAAIALLTIGALSLALSRRRVAAQ
jgi:LPXTG-motif cell wall-anchored protein